MMSDMMRFRSQDLENSLAIHDQNQSSVVGIRARLFDTNTVDITSSGIQPSKCQRNTLPFMPETDHSLQYSPLRNISSTLALNSLPVQAQAQSITPSLKNFKPIESRAKRATEAYSIPVETRVNTVSSILSGQPEKKPDSLLPPTAIYTNSSEVLTLQKQNMFLRNQLDRLQRSFDQRLQNQIMKQKQEYERSLLVQKQLSQASAKQQERHSQEEKDKLRMQAENYARYIQTLERTNSCTVKEVDRLTQELEALKGVKLQLQQITSQRNQLRQTLSIKEGQVSAATAHINHLEMQSQTKSSSYYVQELQKANIQLKKQNKRLSHLVIDRTRNAFKY